MAERDLKDVERAIELLGKLQAGQSFDDLPPKEKAELLPSLMRVLTIMQENPKIQERAPSDSLKGLQMVLFNEVFKLLVFQLRTSPETLAMLAGYFLGAVYGFSHETSAIDELRLMSAEQKGRELWAECSSSA